MYQFSRIRSADTMIMLKLILIHVFFSCTVCSMFMNLNYEYYETHKQITLSICEIAKTYDTRNVLFLSEELNQSPIAESLLKLLNVPVTIVNSSSLTDEDGLFILFGRKGNSYNDFFEKLRLNYDSKFLIVWLQPDVKFLDVQLLFNEFWSFEIANAVSLVEMKYGGIYLYTYYPYTAVRCSDTGPPVFIDSWNATSESFVKNINIFVPKKVKNLQSCPLQCSGTHNPPDSIITRDHNDTYKFAGIGGMIFEFVAQHLNFTPVINSVTDTTNSYEGVYSNETTALAKDIISRKIDVGFGKFSRSIDMHKDIIFAKETGVDCFTWAVPFRAGQSPSTWKTYVDEFYGLTWLLILLSLLLAVGMLFILAHLVRNEKIQFKSLSHNVLFIISSVLGSQLSIKPTNNITRIFTAHWLLYSLVIIAAYQASLGSIVTVPAEISNLHTIDELVESKMSITGSPQMYYILNASTSTTNQILTLLKRFEVQPPGEFLPVLKRVIIDRNIIVFANQRLLLYSNSKLKDINITDVTAHVMTKCLLKSPSSPMLLRRGSPYRIPIDILLKRLLESGIIEHWSALNNMKDEANSQAKFTQLHIRHLKGAFNVLLVGNFSATIVLILEMLFKKLCKQIQNHPEVSVIKNQDISFSL